MTPVDIHPEHLMDRVLRGAANEAERAELALHVRACPACTAEWRLAHALRPSAPDTAPPVSGPALRGGASMTAPALRGGASMTAAVDAALAELTRDGHLAPEPLVQPAAAPVATRAWLPWAVALCLFFTGSAAAATLIMAVRSNSSASQPAQRASERQRAKRAKPAGGSKTPGTPATPEVVTAATPDVAANPEDVLPVPAPRTHRAASAPAGKPVQNAPDSGIAPALRGGATMLFAQARAAALQGEYARAAALYATLEQRFASSPQAHVSQVVLGRLYLEQLADPRAALAHFDAYLVAGGPNRPEALLGRARALRALGRVPEEITTLRQLVDAYPESLYVVPAQERLRAVK